MREALSRWNRRAIAYRRRFGCANKLYRKYENDCTYQSCANRRGAGWRAIFIVREINCANLRGSISNVVANVLCFLNSRRAGEVRGDRIGRFLDGSDGCLDWQGFGRFDVRAGQCSSHHIDRHDGC